MTDLLTLTEKLENGYFLASNGLPNNNTQGGVVPTIPFYEDSAGINFGYGILIPDPSVDPTGNQNAEAVLKTAGVPQSSIDVLNQYFANTASVEDVNNSLPLIDWRTAADTAVVNYYTDVVTPGLIKVLGSTFYNLNGSAQEALKALYYNSGKGFLGSSITSDLQSLKYADAAYELAFKTATSTNIAYEDRSLVGAALMLGFNPDLDGYNSINRLSVTGDVNNNSVIGFLNLMETNKLALASYFNTVPVQSFLSSLNSYIIPLGYYLPQSSDMDVTALLTYAKIVHNNGLVNLTGQILQNINSVFADSSPTVGGVVRLPIAQSSVISLTQVVQPPLSLLSQGTTYVLDPSSSNIFTVGSSLDGHDRGALIVDTLTSGGYATFDAGTYSGASIEPNGNIDVTLTLSSSTVIGSSFATLSFSPTTNAGTVTLSDGLSIPVPGGLAIHLTDPVLPSEQVLLGYLSQLGNPLTAAQLDQLNYNYLNPTNASYVLQGAVQAVNLGQTDYVFNSIAGFFAPGASITGATTVSIQGANNQPIQVSPTNILETNYGGSVNLSQDSISNIQELLVNPGYVTMTNSEFTSAFPLISGSGIILGSTSGTYDLNSTNIDPTATFNLTATDWSGTTLIGNNQDNQTLTASLYGNDTLQAGNGVGDTLVAGEGVDTLVGGANPTTFVALNGLAPGSYVQGDSGNDTLKISGDITNLNINGVANLEVYNNLTLTNDELGSYSNVIVNNGGSITVTTPGTINIPNIFTDNGYFTLTAGSSGGTTIIGDDGNGETFVASATGNDTLQAGNGNGDTLIAGGGNDIITAGNGTNVNITTGSGIDTITTGSGIDIINATNGLTAGSSITGNANSSIGGSTILDASGDISGSTLTNVTSLDVTGPSITLTAAELANVGFLQDAAASDNNLFAASGGLYNIPGNLLGYTAFNMTAASTDATELEENYASGITLTANSSGSDTLYSTNSTGVTLTANGTTGNDTLIALNGSGNLLDARGSMGTDNIQGQSDTGDIIYAGGGANTIYGGINSTIYSGSGVDTIVGGASGDTFIVNGALASGSSIIGNGSGDTFDVNGTLNSNAILYGDLSGGDIFNVAGSMVSGAEIEGRGANNTFNVNGTLASGAIIFDEGHGTDIFNINGTLASGSTIQGAGYVFGGTGNNTFVLNNAQTSGAAIFGGAGTNTFIVDGAISATTGLVGNGSGSNILQVNAVPGVNGGMVDISGANVENIQTLDANVITVTANQLGQEFGRVNLVSGTSGIIYGDAAGGYYTLAGKTINGNFTLEATSSAGSTLVGSDNNGQTLIASSTGADTLYAGNGTGDVLQAGSGNDILYAGSGTDTLMAGVGNDTFYGGTGNDTYVFSKPSLTSAYTIITNSASTGSSTIQFGSTVLTSNVVASRSGNDLILAISTDPITVQNFFAAGSNQPTIQFANGTTWTPQIINALVSTTFNQAQATIPTSPDNIGNAHIGGTLSGKLSVTNSASVSTSTSVSENLDATTTTATGNLTASGSITGLAAGTTDSTDITVSLDSSTVGSKTGTETLNFTSDSAGIPNDYRLSSALPSQTVTVTGGVYRFASASVGTLPSINVHVGATGSEALNITNTATADGFSENLTASVSGATGGLTSSGSTGEIGAGSSSTGLSLGFSTTTAGAVSGTATLALTSDGTGVDGLGTTALISQTVALNAKVYRLATDTVAAMPSNIIVHVGDTVSDAVSITNTAATDGYSENLTSLITGTTGGLTSSGSTGEIAAGATNTGLKLGFSTATAGTVSGTATLALTSDGTGVDGLGTTALAPQTVSLNATVNNYAKAAFEEVSGGGTFATSGSNYTLTYNETTGSAPVTFNLGVLNNVTGPSDVLGGSLSGSTSSGFSIAGLAAFTGLTAGQADTAPSVTFSGSTAGTYTETLTLNATGSNASGYSGALTPETLTITVNVTSGTGQTYTLTTHADTVSGGSGNNTINAASGTLSTNDNINGGSGGTNTLNLQGAGTFDMRAPTTLTNVQVVTAQEGQAAYVNGSLNIPSSRQTVYTRSGLNVTMNVVSDASINSQDPNAAGITIYGNTDSDIFNLGNGNDSVTLGSASETVNGGSGSNIYYVKSSTVGSTIHGGTGANTLDVSGGGTVTMGSNITGIGKVVLETATTLVANNLSNLAIVGSEGADTVTLQNATQSFTTIDGKKYFIATAAAAGALIKVGTDNISTLEITGGGNATLNANDTGNLLSIKLDAATTVHLNNIQGITVTGSTGADTIYAGTGGDTLTGGGGADQYILNSVGADIVRDTSANLTGTSVQNYSSLDKIDLTDLVYGAHTTLSYSQGGTSGVLSLSDGTHTSQITLLGQYSAAGFHTAKDAAGTGTVVTYGQGNNNSVSSPTVIFGIIASHAA